MTEESVQSKEIDFLNVCESEDCQRVGRSLNSMSKKQFLESLKALILAYSLFDQLPHHVMHDLHKAAHFLFCKVFSLGKVAV